VAREQVRRGGRGHALLGIERLGDLAAATLAAAGAELVVLRKARPADGAEGVGDHQITPHCFRWRGRVPGGVTARV
jgi:hypothetical protein